MSEDKKNQTSFARKWVSYRPDVKVLDCTIRDGGLMNDHNFEEALVKAVYEACVAAGIDYMEMGYKGSREIFSPTKYGCWKHCTEDDLRRVLDDNDTALKISVMADADRTDYHEDFLPKQQSVIDMIRVACYIHQVPTAIDMIKDAHDKGYETTFNLMALSTVPDAELIEALEIACESEANCIVVVDSFGSFYSEQVQHLVHKFMSYAKPAGKQVGMHAHNNQQLAYANTIEAIIAGAGMLDASMGGLGRGAGNCPMELLLGFLHNPKFKLRPVLKCIQDFIDPLHKEMQWGPDVPYMITGLLNQHPRSAMQFNDSGERTNIVKFFDQMVNEE